MPGVYLGAGSIKTLASCYIGNSGVKTVKSIYVGVGGSPQLVWPAYVVGSELFDFNTSNYLAYYTPVTWTQDGDSNWSASVGSWTSRTLYRYSYNSEYYLSVGFSNGLRANQGAYISTAQTINASSINYLGLEICIYDSATNTMNTPGYDVYCSVGSSTSGFCSSDSGNGYYDYVQRNQSRVYISNTSTSFYHFCVNLTGCTRTGYFKTGIILVRYRTTDRDDHGELYVCDILVGNSSSISNYNFKYGSPSGWTGTITVT